MAFFLISALSSKDFFIRQCVYNPDGLICIRNKKPSRRKVFCYLGLFFCHTGIEFVKQQCADDTDYGKDEVYNDCASACVSDGKKFTFKRREKGGGHNDADDRMEHDGVMMLEHVIDAADEKDKGDNCADGNRNQNREIKVSDSLNEGLVKTERH